MTLESTVQVGDAYSIHCLKKTWSVIRDAAYDTGSLCFQTKYGGLWSMGFYAGVSEAATNLGATETLMAAGNKWET
jgi:hypothetical protein